MIVCTWVFNPMLGVALGMALAAGPVGSAPSPWASPSDGPFHPIHGSIEDRWILATQAHLLRMEKIAVAALGFMVFRHPDPSVRREYGKIRAEDLRAAIRQAHDRTKLDFSPEFLNTHGLPLRPTTAERAARYSKQGVVPVKTLDADRRVPLAELDSEKGGNLTDPEKFRIAIDELNRSDGEIEASVFGRLAHGDPLGEQRLRLLVQAADNADTAFSRTVEFNRGPQKASDYVKADYPADRPKYAILGLEKRHLVPILEYLESGDSGNPPPVAVASEGLDFAHYEQSVTARRRCRERILRSTLRLPAR